MITDSQPLLADYAANGAERAFRELVTRYVDLVYSTALRLVEGDTHRAEDVAQTVFADLAGMAPKLSPNSALGGWLHRHTCFVARTVMRGERRRQARERQAVEMSALDNQPDIALTEIAPVLDEAINELGADDRDAILLRFFERRNLRSVGEALGVNENVAQKRVARAVQELAGLLRRRGFTLPAATLAAGLAAGAVTAAPAGLAASIAGTVFGGAAAASGSGLTAATLAKLKVGIISAILTAGVVTTVLLHYHSKPSLSEESPAVQQQAEQPVSADVREPIAASPEPTKPSPNIQMREMQREAPQIARTSTDVPVQPVQQIAAVPEKPLAASLAPPIQTFAARPGSRLRIEGTSNIQDWQVESPFIGGMLEVEPSFPLEVGDAVEPGPVQARAEVFIQVRSLKSVEKDGRPYSNKMDEIMYESLREKQYPRIRYSLTGISLIGATNHDGDIQYEFESRGELAIAGVTNQITMPVIARLLGDRKLKISGSTSLKMTSFHIDPPAPATVLGLIKTGEDVSIQFEWVVAPRSSFKTGVEHDPVNLLLTLPTPAFKGTPKDLPLGPNIELFSDKPRLPMTVPSGLKNLAPVSKITCSDKNATADTLARITDGDKEASDQSIIFLRKGSQWVQLDLGSPSEFFAIVIWHAHNMAKIYHDVIVQVADDPDFIESVRTIFNNDRDNTSGLGVGRNREYIETYEGKLIRASGTKARYIRFYSKGSTESALNEYTEIEVYGRPVR